MELRAQAWFAPDGFPPLTRAADYALRGSAVPTDAYQPSAGT